MEKLAKKLIVFVVLFAWMQISGMSLTLMSISPNTQDLYSSPLPYSNIIEKTDRKSPSHIPCEKVSASSESHSYLQVPSQNENQVSSPIEDLDNKSYLFYSLIFLYSVSGIFIVLRISKLFFPAKN
jgi:hypothetical protein